MALYDGLTAIGFWVGTLLPLAYVPVVFTGIDSAFELLVFLLLIVVNVIALVIGHEYPGSRSHSR